MRFRDGYDKTSIKLCVNLGKSATETLATIIQAFGEESMSHTRVFEWHETENVRQAKSILKSMIIIFFDIKVIVKK
jgi:hypothetical protein